jgi:hypothetical protein
MNLYKLECEAFVDFIVYIYKRLGNIETQWVNTIHVDLIISCIYIRHPPPTDLLKFVILILSFIN